MHERAAEASAHSLVGLVFWTQLGEVQAETKAFIERLQACAAK
jgi:hypothetical protein